MRRRARASHLTRRPIHSSLLLQIEDSRSGPRAWSRHLQLAYAILLLELAVSEENSRVILISALQAGHDCAKRIDQLAGDGVQLQIRHSVCERLGRVAKCIKRAPAELRRRLDRAIAPLMRENHIDLEVIEAVFDIAVEIFSAYPRHEPTQTALAALTDQLGSRHPKIKIDFSALNARDRIKAEKNVAALGQACSAADVFAALSAALQDNGTAKVSVQIHPFVDYVAEVAGRGVATPLPPDVPPELENEYREWQRQLDDYIAQWKAEMGKFLESKGYKRKAGGKPQRPTKLKKGTP